MHDESLWICHREEREGLEVVVFAQPAVNLALVQNRIPVVQAVTVRNVGTEAQVDVTVEAKMHGHGSALTDPWKRTYEGELAPGQNVTWTDFGTFHPRYDHLASLDESHPATLAMVVTRTWGDDIDIAVPMRVLAHNEWFNAPIFFASLAAFVQPNTRAVSMVLDEAAELLRAETGDASLGGYQEGPERAAMQAAAIYEALHQRRIRYVSPPASFEDSGQKIRTTAQVLDERLGTCIDLTVTYAACLEQVGLRSLLWLVDGHAFAGFMREEEPLAQAVMTEPNALVNLVESGRAIPVEAAYYGDDASHRFAGAVATAKSRFNEPESLRGVVAVTGVRRDGIRPLPSADEVVMAPGSTDQQVARGRLSGRLELPSELRLGAEGDNVLLDTSDDAPPRVTRWKRSLLDLSTRNRLLNLRASAQVLDLHVPTGTLPLLDDLVHAGRPISLRAQDTLSGVHRLQGARRAQDIQAEVLSALLQDEYVLHVAITEARYESVLRGLQRTARTMLEETGNANLYLTFGALVHTTPSGKEARAPLFLVPARIEGGSGRSEFRVVVDPSNLATPNHCLVEWLRLKHRVQIEALERPKLDDSGIDVAYALPAVRAALLQHDLDFRIDEIATLAICQFSTFGMWQDLERSWDILQRSPIVQHLALHAGESFRDSAGEATGDDIAAHVVDEAAIAVPIPADGSQLRAVALAAAGRTFVLEGPPGTGKSQTITNLIAHALDEGKTVLFVAEKQAALHVVQRRLEAIGLSSFTLDLHGKNQQPVSIRQQLKRAIDNETMYEQHGWDAKFATYRARHAPLAEYPRKVHSKNGLSYSLWSAAAGLRQFGDGPAAPVPASYVASPPVGDGAIRDSLQRFARVARTARPSAGHPWSLIGGVADELDAPTLVDAAEAVSRAFERLSADRAAAGTAKLASSVTELESILPQLEERIELEAFDTAELVRVRSVAWRHARAALVQELDHFYEQHASVLATFTPAFLEDGDVAGLSAHALQAQKGLLGRKRRSEQFQEIVGGLTLDGVNVRPAETAGLVLAVNAARDHAKRLVAAENDLLGSLAPGHWSPLRLNAREGLSQALDTIDRAVAFADEHPALWQQLEERGTLSPGSVSLLRDVTAAAAKWVRLLRSGADDVERWLAHRDWFDAWSTDAAIWVSQARDEGDLPVRRWAQMSAFLDPLRDAGLGDLRDDLLAGRLSGEDAEVAYLRGAAVTSIRERRATAGLEVFNAALRNGEIEDFRQAAAALRQEQVVALPSSLLARRSFHARRLVGPVGELRRQLDAKRKGATFRQLIQKYGEEILEATPCFFVSPTSLAQFVPPGSVTFDLVVFDEASQVTVPQAIGALGRGRSAVIVGDSQQMPPTAVGKVSMTAAGEDEDGEPAEDAPEDLESILTECVESGLPRLWLSWHYRSQDESLIAFSNAHYYEGQLASLPSPGGDPTAGVELRRVDGQFNREDKNLLRTNHVEAEAIVSEIRARLADPYLTTQSIGVVTFNSQQRDLVLNLLEDCGDPLVAAQLREDAEEGIFVKNLENVQGDERDVILFSTAFSKRAGDSRLSLNFGPITREGGEKRLNVAITRARRKVVLFTSFDPGDIDLARTSSRGLAHLRAYMEMAAHGDGERHASGRIGVGRDEIAAAIGEALSARGYEVEADYGLSDFSLDLAVRQRESERWEAAVVLDGPGWARRPTVTDRDLTPGLLEDLMGWGALVRVWLPEWLDDPDGVLDRVETAIRSAQERAAAEQASLEEAAARQAEAMRKTRVRAAAEESAPVSGDSWERDEDDLIEVETYVPANDDLADQVDTAPDRSAVYASAVSVVDQLVVDGLDARDLEPVERDWDGRGALYVEDTGTTLGIRRDLDRTNSRAVRTAITAAARRTVEQEGPIATDRLARSIARRFGFDRVPGARQRFILDLVPHELIHSTSLGDFVWPTQLDRATWRGYRKTPADLVRPLGDIAPEEIINAMAAVVGQSPVTDDEQLFRETLAIFGQKRLTSGSKERLEQCRDRALAESRLIDDGGRYRAGS